MEPISLEKKRKCKAENAQTELCASCAVFDPEQVPSSSSSICTTAPGWSLILWELHVVLGGGSWQVEQRIASS